MTKNNTGNYNTGGYNSGDRNSGDRNTGSYNSGHRNSGSHNSGNYNSGDRNSGSRNSGGYNSGGSNSGNCNSGWYNSSSYNSGFFNTDKPTVRMFNKDTGLKREDIEIPFVDLELTVWVPESKMTNEQKKNDSEFHVKGGTLIKRTYKEAWKITWDKMSENTKQKFKDLPNFCPRIFEEITGIDVDEYKTIIIDGKEIKVSKESFDKLRESLL